MTRDIGWLMCDFDLCLYSERGAERTPGAQHSGIARCIKHGAILTYRSRLHGLDRNAAKAKLAREQEKRDE